MACMPLGIFHNAHAKLPGEGVLHGMTVVLAHVHHERPVHAEDRQLLDLGVGQEEACSRCWLEPPHQQ